MRYAGLAVLVLGVAVAGCGRSPRAAATVGTAAAAPAPIEPPKLPPLGSDVPPALAAIAVERNQRHKRQTGALLTITARWEEEPHLEPAVRIDWTIDYDGPRRPFTILTPGRGTDGVLAHYWYIALDGSLAAFTSGWGGRGDGLLPRKQKDMFSIAADGKPLSGRLVKGGTSLKGAVGRLPQPGDPPMWVQIEYAPTDRGDGHEVLYDPVTRQASEGPVWTLDAWTGRLWSPVVEVAAK